MFRRHRRRLSSPLPISPDASPTRHREPAQCWITPSTLQNFTIRASRDISKVVYYLFAVVNLDNSHDRPVSMQPGLPALSRKRSATMTTGHRRGSAANGRTEAFHVAASESGHPAPTPVKRPGRIDPVRKTGPFAPRHPVRLMQASRRQPHHPEIDAIRKMMNLDIANMRTCTDPGCMKTGLQVFFTRGWV